MRLAQDENQNLITESARRLFGAYSIEAKRAQWHDEWLADAYDKMCEAGMTELARLPDGDAEAAAYLATFALELGRSAIVTPFVTSALAASFLLGEAGLADAGRDCLPGEEAHVMAISEAPSTIRGALSPQTRLGGGRLTGTKNIVPFAALAGHYLVTAAADNGEPCLVRVPADHPGVIRTELESVTGEPLSELRFDCAVPPEAIILQGDQCRAAIKATLTRIFLVQSAILVGGAERALEIVTAHVIERHQFGQALGSFQAVQHHIANSRMRLDAARLMVFELTWRFGEGHDELLAWAAETKAWISTATGELMRRAHELQGGISVTDEHETMLLSRRNLAETVAWGSASDLLALSYPLRQIPPTVQPLFESLV